MRLAILQSNYIPWKGYFDLMAMADAFVVYDSVQYTKNDWRNRNRLISPNGPVWLTIPVSTSGQFGQTIHDATISDRRWARKHWATLSQILGRRPHFDEFGAAWQQHYVEAEAFDLLHDVNVHFLALLAGQLGITTPLVDDRGIELQPDTPTGRLTQLCTALGATSYVTGPAGLRYLETERFAELGIALEVIDYTGYPTYPQTSGEFRHDVSVVDLLSSVGGGARGHLLGRAARVDDPR